MAGTSPRRSIRSRTTQPTQSGSHHSSTSSNSSGRADRNARTPAKDESPRKLTPSGSLSSEPLDEITTIRVEDPSQTRRRKRGQVEAQDKPSNTIEIANGLDDSTEDDEAVRCICGKEDYPGPPQISDEDKKGVKESSEIEFITPADYTEDLAGFFLQCDMCKVWQHGGCVGIKNEDMSPDEYFCEQCRPDLHKIFTASNSQKYSYYLPLYQTLSRGTSRAASFSKDGTRSPRGSKSGRPSSSLQSAKRRSTMNSRDAAYDEEEQLRRAIEASRGEKSGESTDGGTARGKRGRSDSEEKHEPLKRQRTVSGSPSPSNDLPRLASHNDNDSDDGSNMRNGGLKKIRGAAARNHREKELREERERSRAEAANKRKGRAERRRVDDSDPPEEMPTNGQTGDKTSDLIHQAQDQPPSSQPIPDSPPASNAPSSNSHKKGGRPPHTRKGKLGKNQYTKDKDPLTGDDVSPGRSLSRDIVRGDDNVTPSNHRSTNSDGKLGRSKSHVGPKVTMQDMKRKVAAMMDFISRTQIEMADYSMTSRENAEEIMKGLAGSIIPMLKENDGGHSSKDTVDTNVEADSEEKDFKDLNILEMMDVLTRKLVKWQKQFV